MNNKNTPTSISHYGVLGMKWGVRKDRTSNYSSDHKTYSAIRKKKLRDMSDDEIKTVVKRMRLVQSYNSANFVKKGKSIKTLSNEDLENAVNRNALRKVAIKNNLIRGTTKIKDIRKMSDAEVKKHLSRYFLEKQFTDINLKDARAARKFMQQYWKELEKE